MARWFNASRSRPRRSRVRYVPHILGWLAFALNVWGNLALTTKDIKGWIIRLVANAAWIIYSFYVFAWPLFVNHIAFAGINIVGWVRWARDRRVQ